MPIAAVPDYLGKDFTSAAPGHRFYLYFPVWSREQGLTIRPQDKASAVQSVLPLKDHDKSTMRALAERQQRLAGNRLWQLPAKTVAPLTTGLGMEHPLENGFAFLNPYGLPYLPGSGIKGVLRQAARELSKEGDTDWNEALIATLFGPETADTETDDSARRGALIFWDGLPEIHGNRLIAEVMTPHQTRYYEGKEAPHDSGEPNPILFLAIPPGSTLTFFVDCDRHRLPAHLTDEEAWQKPVRTAFEYAFEWLGFGAKTAVGYGHLENDTQAQAARAERQAALEAKRKREERLDWATKNLPEDAANLVRRRENAKEWTNNGVFLDEMEAWLKGLTAATLSPKAWSIVTEEMGEHFDNGLLANPDATKGRQKKPKYKERQKNLAHRLLALKPEGDSL